MMMKGLFGKKSGETKEEKHAREELLKYAKKSLKDGRDEQSIRASLVRAGWQKKKIDDAFSKIKGVKAKPQEKEMERKPQEKDGKMKVQRN
jgi:hypothetical protein